MKDAQFDEKAIKSIFKRKIRCNMCHEIPILKEILISNGVNCFITSECLNHHGLFLCPINDFCNDKSQLDQIKCNDCKAVQKIVNSPSRLFIYCKECNKFLCPSCIKKHSQKFLKTHHILPVSELDYKCQEHLGPFSFFCVDCNKNLCPLCYQREHFKHNKIIHFDKITPSEKEYLEMKSKLEEEKAQIQVISQYLENFVKIIQKKIDEYINNLKIAFQLNCKIFNCYNKEKLNYQSILNFQKIIEIDISDISFIKDIEEESNKFVQMIKSKTSNKIPFKEKQAPTQNVDKELLQTVRTTLGVNSRISIIDEIIENNKSKEKEEINEFENNELLEEIGKTNKKILNKKDIIGIIKKIYSIEDIKIYILIIDNGIFIYDQETNKIINYIEINEGFEYNEIDKFAYYYNKKEKLIYLFLGTKTNKIKIYTINENEDFDYKLIQELNIEDVINVSCTKNGELLILDKNGISIYKNNDNNFGKEKEIEKKDNEELKSFYETENYLIFTFKEKDEIIFYDKNNLENKISIENISSDDKSKIFELSRKLICVSFNNKITVINMEEKKECHCYEKDYINYLETAEVINSKEILISYKNKDNILILSIFEWDDNKKILKQKTFIEDLESKMISKINKNQAMLLTKYGLNLLELRN